MDTASKKRHSSCKYKVFRQPFCNHIFLKIHIIFQENIQLLSTIVNEVPNGVLVIGLLFTILLHFRNNSLTQRSVHYVAHENIKHNENIENEFGNCHPVRCD